MSVVFADGFFGVIGALAAAVCLSADEDFSSTTTGSVRLRYP